MVAVLVVLLAFLPFGMLKFGQVSQHVMWDIWVLLGGAISLSGARETLQRMLIEPERIRVANLGIADDQAYVRLVEEFLADLRRLGPSPFGV